MARPNRTAEILGRDGRVRTVTLPERGSIVRADSIAVMAFPAGSSTNDGAEQAAATLVIDEAGVLAHYVVAPRARIALTNLTHNGEPLTTGYVPATMFGPASVHNPYLGVAVDQTTKVKHTLKNESGGAIVPYAAFSVAPKGAPSRPPRIIALGQSSTITALSTSATTTITFTIERPAVLDRFIGDCFGATGVTADDLYVTEIKYDGDLLVSGAATPIEMFSSENRANPQLGIPVEPGHALTVKIANTDSGNAGEIWAGFSCM